MHIWVACVDGQGVTAMLLQDGQQPALDLVEGFLPGDGLPLVTVSHHRLSQDVGVVVQLFEAGGFWAQVAVTEGILGISTNGDDLLAARFDLYSTGCFTQGTRRIADFRSGHAVLLLC